MYRTITPFKDLVVLWRLFRRIRKLKPVIVQAHMTKAGLLGMLAARLAGVPVRIYQNHGMALFSADGPARWLLKACERTACALADQALTVSPSVRQRAVEEGICAQSRLKVLLSGTPNGVDAEAVFNPARFGPGVRLEMRRKFGIPDDALVAGFVGRIFRIKGIDTLVETWKELRECQPRLHLLFAGDFDSRDPISPETERILRSDPRIHLAGFVASIAPVYTAMDLVVLPSLHEGLGLVLLEASAMGLPVVATRIPGIVDAVRHGVTGTLIPPLDASALAGAIETYLGSEALRREHGAAGRAWVLKDFQPEAMWQAVYDEYRRLLRTKGLC